MGSDKRAIHPVRLVLPGPPRRRRAVGGNAGIERRGFGKTIKRPASAHRGVTQMNTRAIVLVACALALGVGLGRLVPWPAGSPVKSAGVEARASGESLADIQASLKEIRSVLNDLAVEEAPSHDVGDGADEVLRLHERSSVRVPVGPAPGVDALEEQVDALREQVDYMSDLLESLRKSIADGAIPASFPSLDLLRRTPAEQDWSQLQQFIEAYTAGKESIDLLMTRVQWMSQEEVLRNYGRPSSILKDGSWLYRTSPPSPPGLVRIYFIKDYLMRFIASSS